MASLGSPLNELRWFRDSLVQKTIRALERRNILAQYVETREKACSLVLDAIPVTAVVARGDSLTLDQIGILDALRERGQRLVLDPFAVDPDGRWGGDSDSADQMKHASFSADVFLTGTNAVTTDGRLVNIDGVGGRVAAMVFGPKRVFILAGYNKIVEDLDSALCRIRGFAAPVIAKWHLVEHGATRLGDLPCVLSGTCARCQHPWRICNYTVIIDGARLAERGRLNVVLVGEELGI